MNARWKDIFLLVIEVLILILIVYHIVKSREDRVNLFLLSLLFLIIGIHFYTNVTRVSYYYGRWFHCRYWGVFFRNKKNNNMTEGRKK